MRTRRATRRVLAAVFVVLLVAAPALGEDEAEDDALPEEGAPVSDEEAKELAKTLTKVGKRKRASDVMPTLRRIGLRSHAAFHKPLVKLLTHGSETVALMAADILRVQKPEEEKVRKKLSTAIWKKGWMDKRNEKRFSVKGRTLLAVETLEGKALDDKRFSDVERMWRWAVGNPNKAWGSGLVDICEYVRDTEDKRLCRWFGEEIDNPQPDDPNSPTNPPAEWWKRRWELWREIKAACIETLWTLTGESFKTTADAKAWFRKNEKEFGFRW